MVRGLDLRERLVQERALLAIDETVILLALSLSVTMDTPTKG